MSSRETNPRTDVREKLPKMIEKGEMDPLTKLVMDLLVQVKGLNTTLDACLQHLSHKVHGHRGGNVLRDRRKHMHGKPSDDRAKRKHNSSLDRRASTLQSAPVPNELACQTKINRKRRVEQDGECCLVVQRIVGPIEDSRQIEALELLSLVGALNDREIRAVFGLGPDEAHDLFERLRAHEIVRMRKNGLTMVRRYRWAFVTYLHVHKPVYARACVARILPFIEACLGRRGRARSRALGQLCMLVGDAPVPDVTTSSFQYGSGRVAQPRGVEIDDVLTLIETIDGPASRTVAARLVSCDPTSIAALYGASGIDGALIHTDIRGREVSFALREPILEHLVDGLASIHVLSSSCPACVTRVFLPPECHQHASIALHVLCHVMMRQTQKTQERYISAIFLDKAWLRAWRASLDTLRFVVHEGAAVNVGGHRLIPCIGDWADVGEVLVDAVRGVWSMPVGPLRNDAANRASAGGHRDTRPELSDKELRRMIVDALRTMGDPYGLGESRLGLLFFPEAALSERGSRLRDWLEEAIAKTKALRDGHEIENALRERYCPRDSTGSRTFDDALKGANLGRSTFYRRWAAGLARMVVLARQKIS